ncbi:unnamed protein product, partial [marine sediment metagenome]
NKISIKVPSWVPFIGGKTFGFDFPKVELAKYGEGGIIDEPTLLYGLRTQRPYAIAGEAGREIVSPAGGGITNTFQIAQLVVREEADIKRIAIELKGLQDRADRRAGVRG